jgi:tRNA A37 N6-isopentenylltransferase MiaA
MPTKAEVLAEVARLKAAQQRTEYQRLRAAEYPDFRDYLDAVVKGDAAQMEAYVAACLAVKAKYPKPE